MDTSGAAAIILLDDQRFEIIDNTEAYWDIHIKKRILRADDPAEGFFAFDESGERLILSIEGTAAHPGGRSQVIDEEDILEIPTFDDFILYSDQKSKSFRFSGIKPGTEIDIRVRYRIDNLLFWSPVEFQGFYPIARKRYVLVHPSNLDIDITGINLDSEPDMRTALDDERIKISWERTDIPPIVKEQNMPPVEQYVPRLCFSVRGKSYLGGEIDLSSWNGIVEWYLELTRDSLKPGSLVKQFVSYRDTIETYKARSIYADIQNELRYVAVHLGLGGYLPHSCEEVLERGYGDCKDQSAALVAALRESGIESYLVMVRTNDLGRLDPPMMSPGYFNHVIAAAVIGGETVYLDPTCETCSFGVLPLNVQGAHALIARSGERKLKMIPVNQMQTNYVSTLSRISIDSRGTAAVTDTMIFKGMYASMFRNRFRHRSNRPMDETARQLFFGRYPLAEIDSIVLHGTDQAEDSLTLIMTSTIKQFAKPRNTTFIDPLIHGYDFGDHKKIERQYPYDLGLPGTGKYHAILTIPEGMEIFREPDPLEMENSKFRYKGRWDRCEEGVVFFREMDIIDGMISPSEFDAIYSDLNKISELESEKIVIRKVDL